MMEVNGLPLPAALVQAVQDGQTKWMFKALVNAYGDELDCLDVELVDFETMHRYTAEVLPHWSTPERGREYENDRPGGLPFIHDVSRLVVFGEKGHTFTFCLDYRDSREEPAVICWTSYCWRRVAPSFAAFMHLLEPFDSEKFWQKANEMIGHQLPATFVELCEATQRGEAPTEWELKENVDAYGGEWKVFGLRLYCDPEEIKSDTESLARIYDEGGFQHELDGFDPEAADEPWAITDFTGVAKFVWFGTSDTGEVFAFDFGTDTGDPSVVYWHEGCGCWFRVAPNFATFMDLFVPPGEGPDRSQENAPLQPGDEGWEAIRPTARDLLAAWTLSWVVTPDSRVFFDYLARDYAACSAAARREVEAEVREELERREVTDEQRRTHEELWSRLRSRHEALIALLGVAREDSQPLQPDNEGGSEAQLTPRVLLGDWVKHIVVASQEEAQPFLERLTSEYVKLSPEWRLEIEAEFREARERWRMTDEQRRTLDELWERLRASERSD